MAASTEIGYFASPNPTTIAAAESRPTQSQEATNSSTQAAPSSVGRRRGSSITQTLFDANPLPGVWAATGEALARGPGLAELRRNSSSGGSRPSIVRRMSSGGSRNGKRKRRESSATGSASSPYSESEVGGSSKSPGNDGPRSPRIKGRLHSVFFEELDENNSAEKRASRMSLRSSLSGSGLQERDPTRPVSRQPENVYSMVDAAERTKAEGGPSPLSRDPHNTGIGRASTAGTAATAATVQSEGNDPGKNPGWAAVTFEALKSFWKWFMTPMGFLLTIYMLNIVAWGGMLFLLLINAAPAMCYAPPTYKFDCNNISAPRRIWIEITSQIMNGLFCVTGFGLIPWRFRDLWLLMKWRVKGDQEALSKLRKIHGGWWRPDGILEQLPRNPTTAAVTTTNAPSNTEIAVTGEKPADPNAPIPANTPANAPGMGTVAEGNVIPEAGTKPWKLDLVIHLYAVNTYLQAVLAAFMWAYNRKNRPPWATGLFVTLACGVAIAGGGVVWWEGRKLKKMEDLVRERDEERGRETAG